MTDVEIILVFFGSLIGLITITSVLADIKD
jgi:hypothetical protein